MPQQESTQPGPARSPFAGCTIMIVIALVGLFVIGMAIYSLLQQNKEIDKFTDSQEQKIELPQIEGREAELNALHAKMQNFRSELLATPDKELAMELSKEDINFLLATAPVLSELKSQFSVTDMRDGKIIAHYSRALNGMPGSKQLRYLSATATVRPVFAEKSFAFQIEKLDGAKAPINPEFTAQIPPYRLGVDLQKDAVFGPVLTQLTACEVVGDRLVIRRKPGEIAQQTVSNTTVNSAFMRILRVLVIGFLLIAAIGVFISLRASAKKKRAAQ